MRVLQYPIGEKDAGKTVQTFLKQEHGYSSRTLTKLKKTPQGLTINGHHARTVDLLASGDVLAVCFEDQKQPYLRSNQKVPIVYEDEDVVVFNKPAGMPCHPSCGHAWDTLANVFAAHCDRQGIATMFRPLNRLDKDTSGAVLVAKNQFAAAKVTGGFHKVYTAIVVGHLQPPQGRIEAPILREQPEEMKRIVHPDGQYAATRYRVVRQNEEYSLVECELETGRTHQIRVHMAHLGYPLLGDEMYGEPSLYIRRQALHCGVILFIHPTNGEQIRVECPFPADFDEALMQIAL